MLKVERKESGTQTLLILSGTIDETDNLQDLAKNLTGGVTFNLKGIQRINSIGVKNWLRFLSEITAKSVEAVFEEMSPALVEQLNMLSNFFAGANLKSICLPYLCSPCKKTTLKTVTIAEAKAMASNPGQIPCPTCGKKAEFDEIPEDYFRFLDR